MLRCCSARVSPSIVLVVALAALILTLACGSTERTTASSTANGGASANSGGGSGATSSGSGNPGSPTGAGGTSATGGTGSSTSGTAPGSPSSGGSGTDSSGSGPTAASASTFVYVSTDGYSAPQGGCAVTGENTGSIDAWKLNADGSLSAVPGSPFTSLPGIGLAISPDKQHACP